MELRQLQQKLGITTIVVTHDQREAMTMADTVVVMNGGKIRQAASPIEIYRRPPMPSSPTSSARPICSRSKPTAPAASLSWPAGSRSVAARWHEQATLSIRPEDMCIVEPGEGRDRGTVTFVRDLGGTIETFVDLAARRRSSRSRRRENGRMSSSARRSAWCFPTEVCVVLKPNETRTSEGTGRLRAACLSRADADRFFVIPFSTMIAVSFFQRQQGGFYMPDFVFDNYARFLSLFSPMCLAFR